jgi:hypothetical protein
VKKISLKTEFLHRCVFRRPTLSLFFISCCGCCIVMSVVLPSVVTVAKASPPIPHNELVLHIDGLTPPQVNHLRRTLLHLPTLAFAKCNIFQNKTGEADQVLAHHLLNLPIHLEPTVVLDAVADAPIRKADATTHNSIVFVVRMRCLPRAANEMHANPTLHVFGADLFFAPVGGWQAGWNQQRFLEAAGVTAPDTLLMQLKPRGECSFIAELTAQLGETKEHARFMAIERCWLRPRAQVTLNRTVVGAAASVLVHSCKANVFALDDDNSATNASAIDPVYREDDNDEDADARDGAELRVLMQALQNECSYGIESTAVVAATAVVATAAVAAASTSSDADTTMEDTSPTQQQLYVARPHECIQCGCCQMKSIEDLIGESPVDIQINRRRMLFGVRCSEAYDPMQQLVRAVTQLVHSTDPHERAIYERLYNALIVL